MSAARYLFIAGCPRSGTSALTFLLNEHPRLAIGFERYKRVRAQLDPFHFEPEQFFSPVTAETDIRGELLYERLRRRRQSGTVETVGDKVPLYTRVLPQLLERFPGARVLVLTRDPLAVARSFRRRAGDPEDWWPAENDHRLAMSMWNEALASVRTVDEELGGDGRGAGMAGPAVVALVPYDGLVSGDERWLEMLVGFIGVPLTTRLRAEYRRMAMPRRAGEDEAAAAPEDAEPRDAKPRDAEPRDADLRDAELRDAELRDYVERHTDADLTRWARERIERQLEVIEAPARPEAGADEQPLSGGELEERAREQRELLGEMRRPGRLAADELEVLERRYVVQAGELARRGERLAPAASGRPEGGGAGSAMSAGAPAASRAKLRVTFLVPHQRATSGGVYVIEQFARHMAAEVEVCVAVRERPSRSLDGVDVRWAEHLDGDALPAADVLVYPADMRDAAAVFELPGGVGRPVMLFQGYGTPGSPVVEANLAGARDAVAIAHWLVDLALARGIPCAYVPQGLDRTVFAPGPAPAERPLRVSSMTHRLDWKGLEDASEALALVRAERPEVQVALFGTEPVEGVGSFLASPGRRQVAELLHTSAVHLVASWEEGFGLTGAEAIACGAALATTDTKGSRDYAIDGETALVSAPRDPRALADNVLRLLEEVELRTRLVTAGQRRLKMAMVPWPEAARRMAFVLAQG